MGNEIHRVKWRRIIQWEEWHFIQRSELDLTKWSGCDLIKCGGRVGGRRSSLVKWLRSCPVEGMLYNPVEEVKSNISIQREWDPSQCIRAGTFLMLWRRSYPAWDSEIISERGVHSWFFQRGGSYSMWSLIHMYLQGEKGRSIFRRSPLH